MFKEGVIFADVIMPRPAGRFKFKDSSLQTANKKTQANRKKFIFYSLMYRHGVVKNTELQPLFYTKTKKIFSMCNWPNVNTATERTNKYLRKKHQQQIKTLN